MSSTQLTFSLATKPKIDAVHLVGSWDSYKQHLPLSEKKAGKWQGTFKFPSAAIKPGSRYWYYYIINNVKVTYDPTEKSTVEPSTKRTLNVLDVPRTSAASAAPTKHHRESVDIPKGRALSPSRIVAPKPSKPYESRKVREADYSTSPVGMEDICDKLEAATLRKLSDISPSSSVASSRSSRSSRSSGGDSFSSLSSSSSSSCRCNKYGVTRRGDRVKLDCGGRLCGFSDDSDSCSSIDSDSESEEEEVAPRKPRYQEIAPRRAAVSTGRRH